MALLPYTISTSAARRCLVITNEDLQPIPEAIISICDSTEVGKSHISITNDKGTTCIEDCNPESILEIRALGYKSNRLRQNECPDTIILSPESTELQEVTITATRDVITQKSGKFIFTPGSLKTEVSSIFNLIAFVPLVDFNNGAFSIIGKTGAAKIYINGQNPREWGGGLYQALQSIPATRIKRVEIIPDAGSGESASFNGGIINIIVDIPSEGSLHRINGSIGYANKLSSSESYWFGIRKARFRVSGNFNFNNSANDYSSEDYYRYTEQNKTVTENTRNRADSQSLQSSLNLSYNTTTTGMVGICAGIETDHVWNSTYTTGLTDLNGKQSPIEFLNVTRTPWHRPGWGISAWYTEYPRPRVNMIDIIAGYSNNYFYNNIATTNLASDTEDVRDIVFNRNNYYFEAKYLHQFNRNHYIQTGYSLAYLDINDIQKSTGYATDDFRYKELTNSLFAEWNANISSVFSFNIGVRAEHLRLSGTQQYDNNSFIHNYFNIFPSASLSFNVPKGNQSVSLNVSRKITPPLYLSLNPFVVWTSENSYYVGNPDLKPSFSWNVNLNYSFLNNWIFSFQYLNEPELSDNYAYAKDGYTVSSSANLSEYDYVFANLQYAKSFWERLRLNINAGVRHISRKGMIEGADLSNKTTAFVMSIRTNLVISKRYAWRIAAVFRYTSPESGLTSNARPIYTLAAETSKEFPNGIKLAFHCGNILVNRSPSTFTSDTYSYKLHNPHIPVQLRLSASYVFGNMRVQGANERNIEIK